MNRRDRKQLQRLMESNRATREAMIAVSAKIDELRGMWEEEAEEIELLLEPLHPWYEVNEALLRRRALVVL